MHAVEQAVRNLQTRWGITHHTAVHLLRLIGEVGGRTTSGRRSRLSNRLAGGVPGSRHVAGRAFDHVVARDRWGHAVVFAVNDRCSPTCRGPEDVLDEGDHIHWEDYG